MDCVKLSNEPLLYSTFLLWMMTELYEMFPEAGVPDKPRMVSFLDEEGTPSMVQRAFILPPESLMAPCSDDIRSRIMNGSDLFLIGREVSRNLIRGIFGNLKRW